MVLRTLGFLLWSQEPGSDHFTSLSPDPGGHGIRSPEYTICKAQSLDPVLFVCQHCETGSGEKLPHVAIPFSNIERF